MKKLFVVVAVLLLAGCASAAVPSLPKPPKVSELPTSTTLADYSDVSMPKVGGTTTTIPVSFTGGQASIAGRVLLNGSPAGGATVHVERFDADALSGSVDITSDANGNYSVNNVHGGRYRVRAYRSPDASMPQAQVFFLGSTDKKLLDLAMQNYNGGNGINAFVTPDPPILGQTGTLVVSVTSRGVDGGGVVRGTPLAGVPVSVLSAGGKAILSSNPTSTGSNGRASFTFQCASLDRQGITVSIPNAASVNVTVANCELPPTTTTTAAVDGDLTTTTSP